MPATPDAGDDGSVAVGVAHERCLHGKKRPDVVSELFSMLQQQQTKMLKSPLDARHRAYCLQQQRQYLAYGERERERDSVSLLGYDLMHKYQAIYYEKSAAKP